MAVSFTVRGQHGDTVTAAIEKISGNALDQ